jgi:SAM-dependent methyltransferase
MSNKRFGIDYDNTIESNRELWTIHTWSRDGDEWDGQALLAGVPYEEWKGAVAEEFILPYLTPDTTVVEIAAGRGRWSAIMQPLCKKLVLVDLNAECIEYCRTRFAQATNVEYVITDGTTLPGIPDASAELIWSFDSFVHMDQSVIAGYLKEIRRVLRPGGHCVLHHAGRRHATLWLGDIRNYGVFLRRVYSWISMGGWWDGDGWRSNVSPELVKGLAVDAGLTVVSQVRTWGEGGRYGVQRYHDTVTTLRAGDDERGAAKRV